MRIIDVPGTVLSWLGRQGTRAVAALVVIGIALPSIGAVLRPHVTAAVFLLLCLAFLRVDVTAFKAHVRRPAIVLAATAWTSVAVPIVIGVSCLAAGLDRRAPELFLALMLQAIASPMMAAPALAALMGLDATLSLVTLIISTALMPVTAPVLAWVFVGRDLSISPLALAVRLFAILAGAAVVGLVVRRLVGAAAIERRKDGIDGLNILVLFVFVAAIMHGVGARWLESPMATVALAALAFVVFFAILLFTALLFRSAGRERALALSQLPIYLSPELLRPLARRVPGGIPERDARVRGSKP